MPKYYAVKNGRNAGIYSSWDECKAQTNGYSNAKFKSFNSAEEANHYVNDSVSNNSSNYSNYKARDNPSPAYNSGHSSGHTSGGYINSYPEASRNGPRLEMYTDGACSNNGYGGAKGGIGVHFPDCPEHDISEPLSGRQTNNRAEIKAVTVGLQKAKQMGRTDVTVNTDSKFLYDSVNEWQHKWRAQNWKKSDGKEVTNKDDFLELEEASKGMDIKWNKVAAHKGIPGNEAADRLATKAIPKNSRF